MIFQIFNNQCVRGTNLSEEGINSRDQTSAVNSQLSLYQCRFGKLSWNGSLSNAYSYEQCMHRWWLCCCYLLFFLLFVQMLIIAVRINWCLTSCSFKNIALENQFHVCLVFYCGKIHGKFTVLFTGIEHIHIVVPPATPCLSRTSSFQTKTLYSLNTNSPIPLYPKPWKTPFYFVSRNLTTLCTWGPFLRHHGSMK